MTKATQIFKLSHLYLMHMLVFLFQEIILMKWNRFIKYFIKAKVERGLGPSVETRVPKYENESAKISN